MRPKTTKMLAVGTLYTSYALSRWSQWPKTENAAASSFMFTTSTTISTVRGFFTMVISLSSSAATRSARCIHCSHPLMGATVGQTSCLTASSEARLRSRVEAAPARAPAPTPAPTPAVLRQNRFQPYSLQLAEPACQVSHPRQMRPSWLHSSPRQGQEGPFWLHSSPRQGQEGLPGGARPGCLATRHARQRR